MSFVFAICGVVMLLLPGFCFIIVLRTAGGVMFHQVVASWTRRALSTLSPDDSMLLNGGMETKAWEVRVEVCADSWIVCA